MAKTPSASRAGQIYQQTANDLTHLNIGHTFLYPVVFCAHNDWRWGKRRLREGNRAGTVSNRKDGRIDVEQAQRDNNYTNDPDRNWIRALRLSSFGGGSELNGRPTIGTGGGLVRNLAESKTSSLRRKVASLGCEANKAPDSLW